MSYEHRRRTAPVFDALTDLAITPDTMDKYV